MQLFFPEAALREPVNYADWFPTDIHWKRPKGREREREKKSSSEILVKF